MDADLVVIGGGPVGAVLAMSLARVGKRVTVLEKSGFPRDKPCGEGLMPSGVAVLDRLGIHLLRAGFPPLHGVRYRLAGGSSAGGTFRSGGGCGVRRTRLDQLLAERAAPTGAGERLVAVLGPRGALRRPGRSVLETYREISAEAHPELAGAALTSVVHGAGPFTVTPARVAEDRVFLAGDAAGFTDPLT